MVCLFRIIFVIILLSTNLWAAPVYGPFERSFLMLEKRLETGRKHGHVIGASVAVVEHGKIAFIKSFGYRKKGQSELVELDTVFQWGSLSKPVTASLFAIAQKQNRITWETPVTIDGLTLLDTEARHLLNHTSGFSRAGFNWHIENGKSRAQIIEVLRKKNRAQPGMLFDYHNFAFSLTQELVEKGFGQTFGDALKNYLFIPLGMKSASVSFSAFSKEKNRAWPHELDKKGVAYPSADYSYRYHEVVPGSAGVNSNIKDAASFLMLQLGLQPHVLSASELSVLHAPQIEAKDAEPWFKGLLKDDYSCHYGYGFRILKREKEPLVFHGGWVKGFRSIMMFSPQNQRGIIILSNVENNFGFKTAVEFLEGRL